MKTIEQSKKLVKECIHGFRKGTDNFPKPIPNYLHSFGVYSALKKYGFNADTQMVGLLHDIIEDSGVQDTNGKWIEKKVSLKDLKAMGYSTNVVHLVDLATHDILIEDSFERWQKMLKRLIKEKNKNAWAIKLADISNNLLVCHLMPNKERLDRFLNKKCPVFVYYGNKYFGGTKFYDEFLERYFHQVKTYNQYFM